MKPNSRQASAKSSPQHHDWEMLHSNRAAWQAVLDLCEAARESIAIEHYIISSRGIGHTLMELLARKAREGVHVRVLADGYGSFWLRWSAVGQKLLKAGGEVLVYNGLRALILNPITHMRRLHCKLVLCDGRRAIVGGTCFRDSMADWRDTVLRYEGPIVSHALDAFDLAWRGVKGERSDWTQNDNAPDFSVSDQEWAYLTCGPRPIVDRIYRDVLLAQIAGAEMTVDLTTPYLSPDRNFWKTAREAMARGVRMRLIVPRRSNHRIYDLRAHAYARGMARHGVEVYAYEPAMMHAKLALVDGKWASVGSLNLDLLSLIFNLENGISSRDPALCAALGEQIEQDLKVCTPM